MAGLLSVALLFSPLFLLLPGGSCSVCAPLEFKIDTLRSADFWWFETDPKYCYKKPSSHLANLTKCVFLFSVCKPVPQMCSEGSGICQAVELNVDIYKFYSVYIDQGDHDRFKFKTGHNNFSVSYSPVVEVFDEGLEWIHSTIVFKCNHDSKWNTSWSKDALKNPPGPKAPSPVEVTMHKKATYLEYTFVFNSSEGCRIGGPGPGPGPGGVEISNLSVGSILLIFFFPAVFLYCFIGALVNCGSGKTGKDIIPHSAFWRDLPNLIMDGCGFCFAKLTCQEMTTSRETYDRM